MCTATVNNTVITPQKETKEYTLEDYIGLVTIKALLQSAHTSTHNNVDWFITQSNAGQYYLAQDHSQTMFPKRGHSLQ